MFRTDFIREPVTMPHPAESELLRFVRQELSLASAESICAHLEECPTCAEKIDQLEGQDLQPLLATIRGQGGSAKVEALMEQRPHASLVAKIGAQLPSDFSPRTDAEGDVPETPRAHLETFPGQKIGAYRLVERIGQGGMGEVWRAEQERPVRREVALKLIRGRRGRDDLDVRFEAERQALAIMDHPYVARVLDAGATEEGVPFLIMELIQGTPIHEYCDQHRLSIADRLRLMALVAEGLQHAHQKGIIHRDLKPDNLLVVNQAEGPIPKIIDFGLVKAHQSTLRLTEESLETEQGKVLGTLSYMSPEQIAIDDTDVDTRTDIYSLGIVLYELLVGRLPIGVDGKQQPFFRTLEQLRNSEPKRPSVLLRQRPQEIGPLTIARDTTPSRLERLLQGELDWIVMKAIDKDRSRRYQTANELGHELRSYLEGEPVAARPPSSAYRLRKLLRKHRAKVITAACLVATLTLASIVSTWQAVRARRAEATAQQSATRHQRALDFIVSALGRPQPAIDGREVTVASVLEPVLEDLVDPQGSMRSDDLDRATLLHVVGETLRGLSIHDAAHRAFKNAYELRTSQLGPNHADTLNSGISLSGESLFLAKLEEAKTVIEDICRRATSNLGRKHEVTLAALHARAEIERYSGNPANALPLYQEVVDNAAQLDTEFALMAQANLSQCHRALGDPEQALEIAERTLRQSCERLGVGHPHSLMFTNNVADLQMQLGQVEQSLSTLNDLVAQAESTYGSEHMETMLCRGNLAKAYYFAGQLESATEAMQIVADTMRNELGDEHFHTLTSIYNLGRFYQESGKLAEALPLLTEAKETRARVLGPLHGDTLVATRGLGLLLAQMGRREEAQQELDRYLADEVRSRGGEDTDHRENVLRDLVTRLKNQSADALARAYEQQLEPSSGGAPQ